MEKGVNTYDALSVPSEIEGTCHEDNQNIEINILEKDVNTCDALSVPLEKEGTCHEVTDNQDIETNILEKGVNTCDAISVPSEKEGTCHEDNQNVDKNINITKEVGDMDSSNYMKELFDSLIKQQIKELNTHEIKEFDGSSFNADIKKLSIKSINIIDEPDIKFNNVISYYNLNSNKIKLRLNLTTSFKAIGDYEVDAKLSIFPIRGKGKVNLEMSDLKGGLYFLAKFNGTQLITDFLFFKFSIGEVKTNFENLYDDQMTPLLNFLINKINKPLIEKIDKQYFNNKEEMEKLTKRWTKSFNKKMSNETLETLISKIFEKSQNVSNNSEREQLKDFDQVYDIDRGSFGTVYSARHKLTKKLYAIKKIHLKNWDGKENENNLKELKLLSDLEHIHILRYYNAWVETFQSHKFAKIKTILYIQTEYCIMTLENAIENINLELKNDKSFISFLHFRIRFYTSGIICEQILEGVEYLHKNNIIHRDLKSENILINEGKYSLSIKIADLGLSTIHEFEGQSHSIDKGTPKWMAPEVLKGNHYGPESDIYTLGRLFQFLFDIDHIDEINISSEIKDSLFMEKVICISELIIKCMDENPSSRINCTEMLKRKNDWTLNLEHIKSDNNWDTIIKSISFTSSFFMKKISCLSSLWSAIPAGVCGVQLITQELKNLWDDIAICYRPSPVQHGAIIIGSPNIGDSILKKRIERSQKFNYTSKLNDGKNRVISGILVTPVSKEMVLPIAKIVSGDIGSSSVEIEFNSPSGGQWGCNLLICATVEE